MLEMSWLGTVIETGGRCQQGRGECRGWPLDFDAASVEGLDEGDRAGQGGEVVPKLTVVDANKT